MKTQKIIFLVIIFTVYNYSQSDPGAKQIALSNSDVAVSDNVFALFDNPAGLGQIRGNEAGIYYSPAPFGISELRNAYASFNQPMSFGALAVGVATYGFELYRENTITFGGSYNFQNNFYFGLSLDYKNFSIKNYGSKSTLLVNLGLIAVITDELHFGFSYKNISHNTLSSDTDELPVVFRSGFSYKIIKNCILSLAIEKDIRYKTSPRFGIDYKVIKYLSLRSGISQNPSEYSFGIGIHLSKLNFNYAFVSHNELGFTHQFGLIFTFNNSGD